MENVSDKTCRENQNMHFMFNNFVEKYGTARHATDDNMAYALCMLENQGYRHTLRICNNYCVSMSSVVT
jgi:hypothetical protein